MRQGPGGNSRPRADFRREMLTTRSDKARIIFLARDEITAKNMEKEHLKLNPPRPLTEVLRDGEWRGERCFIIGGGPSLAGFDFGRLKGKGRIIAINKAYLDAPFADVLFFMDGSPYTFYGLVKRGSLGTEALEKWNEFKGVKVYLNLVGRRLEDVYSIRKAQGGGLSRSLRYGIYPGNNSGTAAVGLAICLGADPIYLLGIDCKFSGGRAHYHSGYPRTMHERIFVSFIGNFNRLNSMISGKGINVINLNPDSGVRCFPFSTIDKVLGNGRIGDE